MQTAATKINNHNYGVAADGETIGWIVHRTLGTTPGWYFVANDKRLANRFPDSTTPVSTWRDALAAIHAS